MKDILLYLYIYIQINTYDMCVCMKRINTIYYYYNLKIKQIKDQTFYILYENKKYACIKRILFKWVEI